MVEEPPPPFELVEGIHILTATPTAEQVERVEQLRALFADEPLLQEHADYADNITLVRFLRARNWDVTKARDMLRGALEWRSKRQPTWVLSDPEAPVTQAFQHESETGKIRVPAVDRWGRAIMIFDNAVQNTTDGDAQIRFLAWNMELCCRTMTPGKSDKICLFMHLGGFSFFNNPPMKVTKETIHILCNAYPERLGTCVLFQAPSVFYAAYNAVRFMIDEKTQAKIVFVSGDVGEGSRNDKLLRYLIADDWKKLTGTEQPSLARRPSAYFRREIDVSGGFDMATYWPDVLARERAWAERHAGGGKATPLGLEAAAPHTDARTAKSIKTARSTAELPPDVTLREKPAVSSCDPGAGDRGGLLGLTRNDFCSALCIVVLLVLNGLVGMGVLKAA